jgi:hypothetical protein
MLELCSIKDTLGSFARQKHFGRCVPYRTACPILQSGRAEAGDMQSHHESNRNAGMYPHGVSTTRMPAWVKIFGVIYLIAIAVFAATHLVPGGMGHLSHGDVNADTPPAGHGQHPP